MFTVLFHPTASLLNKYQVQCLSGKLIQVSPCFKNKCKLSLLGTRSSNISTTTIPCYQKHSSTKYTEYPLNNETVHSRASRRADPESSGFHGEAQNEARDQPACRGGSFASRPRDDSTGPAAALASRSPAQPASVGLFCLYPGTGSNRKRAAPFDGCVSSPRMTPSAFDVSFEWDCGLWERADKEYSDATSSEAR